MMKQEKKTLSYYRLRLEVYLKDYHPQLLSDETFIRERSEAAAKTYEEAFLQDNPIGIAESMAMEILLGGLHFSPYYMLEQIIENEFANVVPPERAADFALRLLQSDSIRETIAKYEPGDDFDYSISFASIGQDTLALTLDEDGDAY